MHRIALYPPVTEVGSPSIGSHFLFQRLMRVAQPSRTLRWVGKYSARFTGSVSAH
jgi:hypothetical protein